ncbi:MAG: RusA family crossover junction endodeoxyribonuclease [Blautia sp.]
MQHRFVIKGKLPGLNDYLKAERSFHWGHSCGNDMKQEYQMLVSNAIRASLKRQAIKSPITIHYSFYEPNRRRDLDNIAAVAHKFIQDALVKCRVIENDGWQYIKGFSDEFHVDKHNPRIEVTLIEAGGGGEE